jgi:hypothetical protein
MRTLALLLGEWAARLMHPVRPQQALAMHAEIENLPDREALAWALGCVVAACRQRASLLGLAVVSARLCVALAAGAFGVLHVVVGSINLWVKLAVMSGLPVHGQSDGYMQPIQTMSMNATLESFAVLFSLGLLHIAAALMMAIGRNDWVHRLALAVIGLLLVFALFDVARIAWPMIYVVLITMMATTSSGLAWLWKWDERRMARLAQ